MEDIVLVVVRELFILVEAGVLLEGAYGARISTLVLRPWLPLSGWSLQGCCYSAAGCGCHPVSRLQGELAPGCPDFLGTPRDLRFAYHRWQRRPRQPQEDRRVIEMPERA